MEYKLFVSLVFATPIAAVFNFIPVLRPLLAPLIFQATTLAHLGREPIFNFCDAGHGAILDGKPNETGI